MLFSNSKTSFGSQNLFTFLYDSFLLSKVERLGFFLPNKLAFLFFVVIGANIQSYYAQSFTSSFLNTGDGCSNLFNTLTTSSNGTIYGVHLDGSQTNNNQVFTIIQWNNTNNTWSTLGSITAATLAAQTNFDHIQDDIHLTIDASGNFHIVFRGQEDAACCGQKRGVVYGYSTNGSTWTLNTLQELTHPNGSLNVDDPVVQIDASGNPHVVYRYYDSSGSVDRYYALEHRWKSGGTWQFETIMANTTTLNNEITRLDFEISPNGDLHACCVRETNGSGTDGSLFYAKKLSAGGSWTVSQLNTGATGASAANILNIEALPNGDISIMNQNSSSGLAITEYLYSSGSWTNSAVATGTFAYRSYTISSNGDRFLVYKTSGTANNYLYASKPSGASSWTMGTVYADANQNVARYNSVTIHPSGKIVTLFDRLPAGGSCGVANQRETWSGYAQLPVASTSISSHPSNATICEGANTSFSVTATGATGYQWQVNSGGGFSNVSTGGVYSNVTTATLNITGATTGMNAYQYQCVVSGTPNVTSNAATLTVNPTLIPAVSISANPGNAITTGTSVTFTATPTNGGSPTYQWKKNNNNVGTNSTTYTDAALANGDVIACVMTSTATCASPTSATSSNITMTVTSPCTTPTAYAVTGGGAYCAGGAGVAVGLANSETGVTYQLQKDNANDGSPVSGSTGNTISFGTKTATGNYTVIATRTVGACTQNMTGSVNVTINPTPPINAVPTLVASTNTPCAGTQVLLTATPAAGYTGIEYLWSKNGVAAYSQNGGPGTYLVNTGNVAAQVNYSVQMVYGGYSCISSFSASTTINVSAPTATITPNGAVSFCANTPTTLQANAGMSNYVWKRGATIVGTNAASYAPTATGNHNVTVTDANGCTRTSAGVSITVKSLPTANAGTDRPLCEGSSLQIGSSSAAGNTYTWSPITDLNNPYLSNPTTTTTDTITYTLTVNNTTTGCSKTDDVVINSLPLPQMPSITSVTSGTSKILTANSPGATAINWYKNGANFLLNKAPNSSITVAISNPTNAYTLRSKGTNGCLSAASMPTNVRLTASDKEVFAAYPNPTSGLLIVEIANLDMNAGKLLLSNSLGQIIIEKEVNFFAGKAQLELDMSQLPAGIYHLSLGEYVQKIVKE